MLELIELCDEKLTVEEILLAWLPVEEDGIEAEETDDKEFDTEVLLAEDPADWLELAIEAMLD